MRDREPVEPRPRQDPEVEIRALISTTRTGGAYIPPGRLRLMQEQLTDKSSNEYQRMSWEALKKSINGLINKVCASGTGSGTLFPLIGPSRCLLIVMDMLMDNR